LERGASLKALPLRRSLLKEKGEGWGAKLKFRFNKLMKFIGVKHRVLQNENIYKR